MELRQLRMFVAVAEEGGFSRAADRLHVVQSAVSAGIRGLERELGTALFDRSTRHVELSDAGRALLPEARRVLSAVALASDSVAQVGGGLRGSVTLGTMQAQGMRRVSTARLIASFQRDHPGVRISARHVGGSTEMARQIARGPARPGDPVARRPGARGAGAHAAGQRADVPGLCARSPAGRLGDGLADRARRRAVRRHARGLGRPDGDRPRVRRGRDRPDGVVRAQRLRQRDRVRP